MDLKILTERDICTKLITPALEAAGWDKLTQMLEEFYFTDGKIYVRGKMTARGKSKRADCCCVRRLRWRNKMFSLKFQEKHIA